MQQDLITRSGGCTDQCAGANKPAEAEHQRQGADHDVAIGREQGCQAGPVQQPGRRSETAAHQKQSEGQRGPFGNGRSGSDSRWPKVQACHEPDVQNHIYAVHDDLYGQHLSGLAGADQPAGDTQSHEIGGRAENAGVEIADGEGLDMFGARKGSESEPAQ